MARTQYNPTYLREWRKFRGLSQNDLADLMLDDDGNRVVSNVSVSRIEKGLQPYTQPVLEALAKALNTTPAAIISYPPGEVGAFFARVSELDPEQIKQAQAFLDAIAAR